jgi:tetratricopeptide (TPR) repeat protein
LVDGPQALEIGPTRDRVLWQYRLAAAALRRGQFAEARQQLDDALARVGSIFNADASSRRARGYFTAEAKKTFLGEPYERVMAYYYRGLVYWRDGEPDNARACFRSAQFQDGDAEEKTYASDYVLLDYLDGLATLKLKGDGADAIKRARSFCRLAIPPDPNPAHNVLFFVEYGQGPTKLAAGEYGEQLKLQPGTSQAQEVKIHIGPQTLHLGPYDDLNFQATTRGGRVMDHILGNKAVFKSATDAAGDAAILSGAVLAGAGAGGHSAADEVGAGLIIAGVISKIVSAATTPKADTRTWDNLPVYLSFGSLQLAPGQYTATVDFLDPQRRTLAGLSKTITFNVPDGTRDTVIYISDKSITPQTL